MADDLLGFDEATARRLEAMYQTPEVLRRRSLGLTAVDAQPGERILDVGCGPGFYVADLSPAVGGAGSVVGIDTSQPMLAIAQRRCDAMPNVEFREGSASAIPFPDASFDAVLSVQVFEYIDDVPQALAELRRVTRPGGRVMIWDTDWATVSWHSSDEDRMRYVLSEWDAHLTHPSLPRVLAGQLRAAGWRNVTATGHSFTNLELTPDAFSSSLIGLVTSYVADRVDAGVIEAWEADLRRLSEAGEYFFTGTQFCFTATNP